MEYCRKIADIFFENLSTVDSSHIDIQGTIEIGRDRNIEQILNEWYSITRKIKNKQKSFRLCKLVLNS